MSRKKKEVVEPRQEPIFDEEEQEIIYRWDSEGYYSHCTKADMVDGEYVTDYCNGTVTSPVFKEGFLSWWDGVKWVNVRAEKDGTRYFKEGEEIKVWKNRGGREFPKEVVLVDEKFNESYYLEGEVVRKKDSVFFAEQIITALKGKEKVFSNSGVFYSGVLKGEVVCDIESRLAVKDLLDSIESDDELVDYYYKGGVVQLSREELKELGYEMFSFISKLKKEKMEKIREVEAICDGSLKEEEKIESLKGVKI